MILPVWPFYLKTQQKTNHIPFYTGWEEAFQGHNKILALY